MSAPKPPAQLIDLIQQKKCVVFVGAGLSMQAGLPSWQSLLRGMVDELANLQPEETEELKHLLDQGKLLDVAEYCKFKDAVQFSSILEQRLRGADCPVPEAHRILARLPFAGVVTTNYDKLIERGWRHENNGEPRVLTHADAQALGRLLLSGGYFVLKAHGEIDRPKSIVLTAKDYQELIHGDTAFESVFSAILLTRAILFLGYSLADPDFKLMMEAPLRRFEGFVPPRYALMTGMGEIEKNVLRWTSGVQVIHYENADGSHAEVVEFLRELENATAAAQPVTVVAGLPGVRAAAAKPGPEISVEPAPTLPATILSIRLEGSQVVSYLSTGTDSWSVAAPDWDALRSTLGEALVRWDRTAGSLAAAGAELTRLVHPEVLHRLSRLPEASVVGIEVSSELHSLPWDWVLLPTPEGGRPFLTQRFHVFRRPGVSDAVRGYPSFSSPTRTLLIADPEASEVPTLPGALKECEQIAAMLQADPSRHEVTLLARKDATYSNLAEQLRSGNYDVIHFAGHAWADAQSSFLILAGSGEYLRSMDLGFLIRSRPPALMFLNSHFTSFVPLGMEEKAAATLGGAKAFASTGSGRSGFAWMAAEAGVGAFIGTCHDALSDEGARDLALRVYEGLLGGDTVVRALGTAVGRHSPSASGPEELFYVMSGHPDLRFPPGGTTG